MANVAAKLVANLPKPTSNNAHATVEDQRGVEGINVLQTRNVGIEVVVLGSEENKPRSPR